MSSSNPVIPLNDPSGIVGKFVFHGRGFGIHFNKHEIFKLKPGHIFPVIIRIVQPAPPSWNNTEFIVFIGRITPLFEIEQVGAGYPCGTEARAKEIAQIVEAKNETHPHVVLISWDGGFWIGTVFPQNASYRELVLYRYKEIQRRGKRSYRFSLRHFKTYLGKPAEMIKEEFLTTQNAKTAQEIFERRDAEIKSENALKAKESQSKSPPAQPQCLQISQLLVLSRVFPETVKLLLNPIGVSHADAYAAYQRDLVMSGRKTDELLTLTHAQLIEIAKSINKKRRQEQNGVDEIEYELVAGWFFRGYANMTPEMRAEALRTRGLSPPSGDAIRKMCKRLKLPSIRKPGPHNQ